MILQDYRSVQGWNQSLWKTTWKMDWQDILSTLNTALTYMEAPEVLSAPMPSVKEKDETQKLKDADMNLEKAGIEETGALSLRGNNTILNVPFFITFLNHTDDCVVWVPEDPADTDRHDGERYRSLTLALGQYLDSLELSGRLNEK